MTRPFLARIAACLCAGLVGASMPAASAVPPAAEEPSPLAVTITSMSPSTVPRNGTVTVTGEVTNRSESSWTDLNVYLLTSSEPITSEEELEAAAQSPAEEEVGGRITTPGLYQDIDDLEPGESTGYRLSVPASQLSIGSEPGVYWLGVHVLGANEEGRVEGADGRARTFIPRMPATAETTSLSLVLPVRGRVLRDEEGRLANPRGWSRRLGPEGRLGRLVDFAQTASATGGQLTLLVDPAVLDAAASIANGNPPLSTGPTDVAGPAGDTEPSASPSEPPPDDADTDEEAAELEPDAQRAADWLAELTEVAEENTTLAVAYADADAASLYRNDYGNLFERATKLSADTMATYGVDAEPVVAPSSGYLPNDTLNRLDSSAPLLLSDRAAPDATNSLVRTRHGHETLLTDSAASSGGPAPGRPYAALAMRQRILAEAAVHSLGDTADQPMVVKLPERWTPDRAWSSASFFTGIDLPWLRTVDVPTARNLVGPFATRGDAYDRPLAYPRAERRAELPTGNLVAAAELNDVGQVFASLLTRNDTVDEQLAEIAMSAVSSQARRRPRPAVNAVRRTSEQVHGALDRIRIEGPPSVTMSSAEGSFQVTVVNDLEEPVTVGIRANTGSPDLVIPDTDPVELGPRQRATVRLSATATNIGVRSVILVPTTVDGKPVGNSTKFSVRSSQVGLVIWIIMGAGAIVLFGAIALRIVRRVRAARGAQRSTPEPVDEGDTT